jgi:hypothetical protein
MLYINTLMIKLRRLAVAWQLKEIHGRTREGKSSGKDMPGACKDSLKPLRQTTHRKVNIA